MMWHEFEELAGYEVSVDDYTQIIEPMYMVLPNVSKQEFVKMIDKRRFALKPYEKLRNEMRALARSLKNSCTHYTDYETIDDLNERMQNYIGRKYIYHTAYYFNEGEYGGCHYPIEAVVYNTINYQTLEKICLE